MGSGDNEDTFLIPGLNVKTFDQIRITYPNTDHMLITGGDEDKSAGVFSFFLSTNPMKGPKPSVSLSLNTSILCLFHSAPSPLVATEDVHL